MVVRVVRVMRVVRMRGVKLEAVEPTWVGVCVRRGVRGPVRMGVPAPSGGAHVQWRGHGVGQRVVQRRLTPFQTVWRLFADPHLATDPFFSAATAAAAAAATVGAHMSALAVAPATNPGPEGCALPPTAWHGCL